MIKETISDVTFIGGIFDGQHRKMNDNVNEYHVYFEEYSHEVHHYVRYSSYVFILSRLATIVEANRTTEKGIQTRKHLLESVKDICYDVISEAELNTDLYEGMDINSISTEVANNVIKEWISDEMV